MTNKDEALKMAHKTFMQLNERSPRKNDGSGYFDKEINACKEALEQPAEPRLVSYAPDGSTCTLNIDGKEVYFNREQPEGKEFFERGKEIARWADKQAQEPVGVVSWHEGAVMGSIFPSSNMPKDGDKLYTHPHQWQGLTDDEIVDWFEECFGHDEISETTMWFAKRLVDAIKEKNDIK